MLTQLKRLLIGAPLSTSQAIHERLNKRMALAIFSSDNMSSVAYASEAIMFTLVSVTTLAALQYTIPISVGIVLLIVIVAFSYRQIIQLYPNGGGAYVVASDNLGTLPGLTAAASLMIDYTLTVAVSIAAGVAAITSFIPAWNEYKVYLCLGIIVLVTLGNLRGVRESGMIFAIPTYLFLGSVLVTLAIGLVRWVTGSGPVDNLSPLQQYVEPGIGTISTFVLLRAFASGCTAMTGIETISNGVPAFKQPEAKNAQITLMWMAGLLMLMFLGISFLAIQFQAVPIPEDNLHYETVLSQLTRASVGTSPLYYTLQIATLLILTLAANSAFAGFPRLLYLLARDRFMPRQFMFRGDRLAFSNGIILLAALAGLLIVGFGGNVGDLLHLYATGVFIGFTLSQTGMVVRWWGQRGPRWQYSLAVNAIGAVATGIVAVVIIISKFASGAWAVVLLIPLMMLLFTAIQHHYRSIANQLRLHAQFKIETRHVDHAVVVLISDLNEAAIPALQYGRSISNDVRAVYVNVSDDPAPAASRLRARWEQAGMDIPLVILESPYRSLTRPLLNYIAQLQARKHDNMLTIILPEFVPRHWWEHILHGQTGLLLKAALLFHRHIVVVNVRYYLA